MLKEIFKLNNKRQGSAIVMVITLLVIMTIIASSVIFISRQNTLETVRQEQRMHAYYLALSGIEIGYATLMAEDTTPGPKYINQFISNFSKADISHTEDIMDGSKKIGKVDILIGNVTIDGKRWIQIEAIGTLEDSGVSTSSTLRIDPSNTNVIVREQFSN